MTIKRIIDFIGSLFGIIILSPLMIMIAILVWLKIGSPVFFIQNRPGLYGKPFKLYKFRTMTNAVDKNGELKTNKERMTSFGSFLRSYSLDELPELYNVLIGDMSLVGPRPLLMDYLKLYDDSQKRRMDVKPGITGWAQVNGRNMLGWQDKFKMDVWYVDNQSLRLDIKILILTIKKVLKREGIAHEGDVAMPRFKGNNLD